MKCSLSTVYRLLDPIEETGRLEAIYLYNGVVKFDKAETCVLLNIARANRFQSRRFIAQRYQALRGITISLTSVTRILAKYSLSYYIAKCKSLLTDIQKKARMDFSRMNYHQPLEYWRTFMYTDECCSRCYQNRQQKVLRTKEQEWIRHFLSEVQNRVNLVQWSGALQRMDIRADCGLCRAGPP
ncbi:Transposase_Tc1-like protein [Hexamita inflata]|uniref:Transposase_Tc1-like protein n=1 Tax=Hexamita inflata TaxID=28002 RepID=A0ABP1HIW8_9EUKA